MPLRDFDGEAFVSDSRFRLMSFSKVCFGESHFFQVYPTTLRAVGLGASSAMARIGAIVTPFVAQVASGKSLSLPIGIYGTTSLLGLIASLSLPIETRGRKMQV
ncbi:unnamed protein product [Strongylus vulgaris]|uniref:Major facilitator superfamily (MFS) profile domain-containing protein n=1 Tax=Strongylus vulgaris TaxID=40348 RepID=A0A3P7IP97_STRVU|nr:unnamed protein product [Strongylus vulgaris]